MPGAVSTATFVPSLSTATTSTATTPMPASPRSLGSGSDNIKVEGEERANVEELAAEIKEEGEGDSAVSWADDIISGDFSSTRRFVMLKGKSEVVLCINVAWYASRINLVDREETFPLLDELDEDGSCVSSSAASAGASAPLSLLCPPQYEPLHSMSDLAAILDDSIMHTDLIQAEARASRLAFLLDKSTIYAKIIGDRMERQQIEKAKAEKRAAARKGTKEKHTTLAPTRESSRKKEKTGEDRAVEDEKAAPGKRKRKSEVAKDAKRVKLEEEVGFPLTYTQSCSR